MLYGVLESIEYLSTGRYAHRLRRSYWRRSLAIFMAVSSYRKSFAFANTSNTGGKLLVLQAQDSHRTNLRAVQVRAACTPIATR